MAISMSVSFLGQPGGPEEEAIKALAKQHKGRWWAQGTNLVEGIRDVAFDFPTNTEADTFRSFVKALPGVINA